jgi:hypothetical protein
MSEGLGRGTPHPHALRGSYGGDDGGAIKATEQQLFTNLAGITDLQRISIYADDVVMFCKPLRVELEAIKAIM